MTPEEFTILVSQMRKAQREYFRTRSNMYLSEAKKLEKKVDYEVERAIGNCGITTTELF